jgi:multiple sugar transport system ATP-binding protein
MNFLPATSKGSGKWDVAGVIFDGPAVPAAEFAIRPEDVTIADHGLRAEVRVVEPLGPHTLVTTTVGGQPFRAVLDSTITLAPGDLLTLAPVPDRIRWFNPETQIAL